MFSDRFGLPLSTSSVAARNACVDGSEGALIFYPGAPAAYDSAITADPDFALAHAGNAQVLMREGDVAGARAAFTAAKDLVVGLTEREASHIAIFEFASMADRGGYRHGHKHLAVAQLSVYMYETPPVGTGAERRIRKGFGQSSTSGEIRWRQPKLPQAASPILSTAGSCGVL